MNGMTKVPANAPEIIERYYEPKFQAVAKCYERPSITIKEITHSYPSWTKDVQWMFDITRDALVKVAEVDIPNRCNPRVYWMKLDDLNAMACKFTIYTSKVEDDVAFVFGKDVFSKSFYDDLLLTATKEERDELLRQYLTSASVWPSDKVDTETWKNNVSYGGTYVNMRMQLNIVKMYGGYDNHHRMFLNDFIEFVNGLMEAQDPGPRSRKVRVVLKFDIMDWERFIGKKYNPELLYQCDCSNMYE